jgi:hypothetical protein
MDGVNGLELLVRHAYSGAECSGNNPTKTNMVNYGPNRVFDPPIDLLAKYSVNKVIVLRD